MAMGTRQGRQRTEEFWIPTSELATPAGHPFYERLNKLLEEHDFDSFVEPKFGHCCPKQETLVQNRFLESEIKKTPSYN